jgi:4'-phosphopantetheinyl transferase
MTLHSLPDSAATLARADVHVWYLALDLPTQDVTALAGLLAADEAKRASRYRFPQDRARFIVSRGWLRLILGSYLAAAPDALRFEYNEYGKPRLGGSDGLSFNVSRSANLACVAVTRMGELGVDIERIRLDIPVEECERIAERSFHPKEWRALQSLPRERLRAAFYASWARTEAYGKACGTGLLPSFTPRAPTPDGKHPVWQFLPLPPPAGFAAALVAERTTVPRRVLCRVCAHPDIP